MPPPRPASLKVRALQWLAQREHSRAELRDKLLHLLRRRGHDAEDTDEVDDAEVDATADHFGAQDDSLVRRPGGTAVPSPRTAPTLSPEAEVDALLAWLEQRGYLSDARFAESRVHVRQARYGNQRIRQELRQHGVALDPSTAAALAGTEFSRACAVWRRKYDAPAPDAAGRLRQARFLAARGFSMAVIQRVLKTGGDAPEDAEQATSGTDAQGNPAD